MNRQRPMRRRLLGLGLAAGWLNPAGLVSSPALAATTPLTLGIVPYLSPAALLGAFRPVREHLERALGRPVEVRTAKDFRSMVEATRALTFDAVLLPAHVARLAIVDWRYEPLASTVARVAVQVLVHETGPVKRAADLRGGKAGMLDQLSLTSTVGRNWLQGQGLSDSVTVVEMPSINSALFALDRAEVSMVVATSSQLVARPEGTPRTDRVLTSIHDISGPIYVARPGLAPDDLAALRKALASFEPNPAQPSTASNTLLQPPTAAQLSALNGYARMARKALAQAR